MTCSSYKEFINRLICMPQPTSRQLPNNHSMDTAEVAEGCKTPVHDRNATTLRPQLCPTLASIYCNLLITNRTRECTEHIKGKGWTQLR